MHNTYANLVEHFVGAQVYDKLPPCSKNYALPLTGFSDVPRPVRSGLSGGSQNTTSVMTAMKIQGSVRMKVEKTSFRFICRENVRVTHGSTQQS